MLSTFVLYHGDLKYYILATRLCCLTLMENVDIILAASWSMWVQAASFQQPSRFVVPMSVVISNLL